LLLLLSFSVKITESPRATSTAAAAFDAASFMRASIESAQLESAFATGYAGATWSF
jgi:hypothetical protein